MELEKPQVYENCKKVVAEGDLKDIVDLNLYYNYCVSREQGKFQFCENNDLKSNAQPKSQDELQRIQGFEDEVKKSYKNFAVDMEFKKGDAFPVIRNNHLLKEDKTVDIVHQKGQVILLDIWATWCGPCQKPMQHNQDLLKANSEKWQDKVRIVCLSVDDSKEAVNERLEEKGWNLGEQYTILGWNKNHDAIRFFQVKGIPKIILVDKEGTIVYTGHPSSINLEEKINELLEADTEKKQDEKTEKQDEQAEKSEEKKEGEKLSEEQYMQGYNFFKDNLMPKLNDEFKEFSGSFKIDGTKHCAFKNGIETVSFSQFEATMKVDVKQKALGQSIKEEIEKLPKELFKLDYEIDDPKEQMLRHVKKLTSLYQENDLNHVKLEVNHSKQLKVVKKKLVEETNTNFKQYEPLEKVDAKSAEKWKQGLEQYINSIYQSGGRFQVLIDLFYAGIEKTIQGRKFDGVKELHKTGNKEEKCEVQHEEGQVLIVDFWAPWCGPCLSAMSKNQTLLEENKGKVDNKKLKIVAISLDEAKEDDQKFIDEKGWKGIEFYQFLGKSRESPEIQFFDVNSIPFIVIVGPDGKIDYAGNPGRAGDLQKRIDSLIENNGTKDQQKKDVSPEYEDLYRKCKEVISKLAKNEEFDKVIGEFLYNPKIIFTASRNRILKASGDMDKKEFKKPMLTLELRENDMEKIRPFVDDFINQMGGKQNVEIKEDLIKTIDIPIGQSCVVCSKNIDQYDPHYYCYHTNAHVCRKCAEFEDKTKSTVQERYKYPHNLAFINVKGNFELLKNIEVYKFGKDVQPDQGKEISQRCNYGCNGCGNRPLIKGESMDGLRYICLTCRPGPLQSGGYHDYCHTCFNVAMDPNHEMHQKGQEKFISEGHQYDHVLFRILTDVGGYYDF